MFFFPFLWHNPGYSGAQVAQGPGRPTTVSSYTSVRCTRMRRPPNKIFSTTQRRRILPRQRECSTTSWFCEARRPSTRPCLSSSPCYCLNLYLGITGLDNFFAENFVFFTPLTCTIDYPVGTCTKTNFNQQMVENQSNPMQ